MNEDIWYRVCVPLCADAHADCIDPSVKARLSSQRRNGKVIRVSFHGRAFHYVRKLYITKLLSQNM